MTITEFLLARIAEDEREATACLEQWSRGEGGTKTRWVRQLAECEAKRLIVADHTEWGGWRGNRPTCDRCYDGDETWDAASEWPCLTLRALASVYREHGDHDAAWAPDRVPIYSPE